MDCTVDTSNWNALSCDVHGTCPTHNHDDRPNGDLTCPGCVWFHNIGQPRHIKFLKKKRP